ncbi:uncharacterized protein [Drosophila tropicalis]|uniref:uncharacterized protein n=1 Tax=Drosophila tropicalis TaxID=46794 RepID=UPI0035AB7655
MERGDWHWSDEESDDDEPDMMDPVIAASSDEENDEDVEDSGYGSEESEAESAINQGHQEEDEDDEMWRELGEAIAMMEDEVAEEASSGRSSPEEYAPWEQNEIYEPPARLWEPARPPTPFRMVDSRSEASETAEVAVADEGAADGVASPPPTRARGDRLGVRTGYAGEPAMDELVASADPAAAGGGEGSDPAAAGGGEGSAGVGKAPARRASKGQGKAGGRTSSAPPIIRPADWIGLYKL